MHFNIFSYFRYLYDEIDNNQEEITERMKLSTESLYQREIEEKDPDIRDYKVYLVSLKDASGKCLWCQAEFCQNCLLSESETVMFQQHQQRLEEHNKSLKEAVELKNSSDQQPGKGKNVFRELTMSVEVVFREQERFYPKDTLSKKLNQFDEKTAKNKINKMDNLIVSIYDCLDLFQTNEYLEKGN